MGESVTSFRKFRLLLWKNYLLQLRHICSLIIEIVFPVLFCLLVVGIRSTTESKEHSETKFEEFRIGTSEYLKKEDEENNILAYSPKTEYFEKLINKMSSELGISSPAGFENAENLQSALKKTNFTAVIQFPTEMDASQQFEFKIRFPSILPIFSSANFQNIDQSRTWQTNKLYPDFQKPGPRNSHENDDGIPVGYVHAGFIPIQHTLAMEYIKDSDGYQKYGHLPEIKLRRFPYPEYIQDDFLNDMRNVLPLFLVLGFIASAMNITRYVAYEKEKQLKEVMKIMGIPNWIHWLAWFVRSLSIMLVICSLITYLFKISSNNMAVFTYSHWSLIFIFFLFYNICIMCFSFMIAVFFDRATMAAAVSGLMFFITFTPIGLVLNAYDELNLFEKIFACLNLNFGMTFAIHKFFDWEATGEGVQYGNLFESVNDDDSLSLGLILLMMLFSAALYMAVCLYVEQVYPGEFGVPKKWDFAFKKDFWSKHEHRKSTRRRRRVTIESDNLQAFEQEPENKRIGVEINGLGKSFDQKWAVSELTLNMYENEITVLLGHNGAGKTTTISMLTGMLSPTTGTAYINGCDIRTDIEGARSSMGICPQHNVLFDDMSVANHLKFFAELKGLKGEAVKAEINKYLNIIELKPKANALSKTLSGGMKRKLTLCCAFCGGNKVVLCDEPSSGMDPAARRQLWDLLQAEKIGRTILLTTHYMDEAEVLGDRIAIMCNGELKCYGSPFFLKKHFGSGYRLVCVKTEQCNVEATTKLLSKYINEIEPESEIGTELTYRLPDQYSGIFGRLLKDLENNGKKLGISGFGISIPTLEEVFMKIGDENSKENTLKQSLDETSTTPKASISTITDQRKDSESLSIFFNDARDSEERGSARNSEAHERKDTVIEIKDANEQKPERNEGRRVLRRKIRKRDSTSHLLPKLNREKMGYKGRDPYTESDEEDNESTKKNETIKETKVEIGVNTDFSSANFLKDGGSRDSINVAEESKVEKTNEPTKKASVYDKKDEKRISDGFKRESLEMRKSKGAFLIFNQWSALFYKKMIYSRGNKIVILIQNALVVLFITLAMLARFSIRLKELPPLTFSLKQYSRAIAVLEVKESVVPDSIESKIAENYKIIIESTGSNYKLESTNGVGFIDYILKLGRRNQALVNKKYLVGATIDNEGITAWFNNQPLHTAPLALNLVDKAIAKTVVDPKAEIITTNYPLPFPENVLTSSKTGIVAEFYLLFLLGVGLAFVTAFYAITIIKERISRSKLLQFIGGARIWAYWLTHYLWDCVMLTLTVSVIILTMAAFNEPGYSTYEELFPYFLLLLAFSFAVLPYTYFFAGFFTNPVMAYSTISAIYCFSGTALAFCFFILVALQKISLDAQYYLILLSPHFALICAWLLIQKNAGARSKCKDIYLKFAEPMPLECETISFFAWKSPGILKNILAMLLSGILLLVILITRDYNRFDCGANSSKNNAENENELEVDVKAEKDFVMNMTKEDIDEHYLVLDEMAKYYGKFLAVNYITLAVKGKECFGLLGVNGAGKTSTFKMLIGDERISLGDAFVRGISVTTNIADVYRSIGYCPQFDALLEDLTGRETLYIYCLLRGVPRGHITAVSEELANTLDFMKHIDKPIKVYSGGNKRKVSAAIAILGTPAVIFLDEPTAGMDPAARRQLWNVLCLIRDSGQLIVLTTHSMEECEALCTKVTIMVNGQFKCIGSTQHLKNKFSKGLVLKILAERLPSGEFNSDKIQQAIKKKYSKAVLESEYQGMLTFYVPSAGIKWSDIFSWLESNRTSLKIKDYSISQTTLEEIFLGFAAKQVTATN